MSNFMLLNYLFATTGIIYALGVPFAVWDHFIPHVDPLAEYNEYVEKEEKKELERIIAEWDRETNAAVMRDELERYRRDNGYSVEGSYEGTCGPPDRDR